MSSAQLCGLDLDYRCNPGGCFPGSVEIFYKIDLFHNLSYDKMMELALDQGLMAKIKRGINELSFEFFLPEDAELKPMTGYDK